MTTRSAGGLLCAVGLMVLSGCTLTIVNDDDIGSALNYKVFVNGDLVDEGTIPFDDSVDVSLGFGGTVKVEGVAVDDGFDDEVTFETVFGKADYELVWTSGFPDAAARGNIR